VGPGSAPCVLCVTPVHLRCETAQWTSQPTLNQRLVSKNFPPLLLVTVPKLPMLDASVWQNTGGTDACVSVWYDLGSRSSMWCQAMRFAECAAAPFDARRVRERSTDITIASQRYAKPVYIQDTHLP
jgi:hypothetical protein